MKICRFSAAKIEDDTLSTAKLVSSTSIFIYLLLSPYILKICIIIKLIQTKN